MIRVLIKKKELDFLLKTEVPAVFKSVAFHIQVCKII